MTDGSVMARVACNTTISAVTASLIAFLLGLQYNRRMDPLVATNGTLAGLDELTRFTVLVDRACYQLDVIKTIPVCMNVKLAFYRQFQL